MAKINKIEFEGRVIGEVRTKTFGSGKVLQEWAMGVTSGKKPDGSWGKGKVITCKHWGTSAPQRGQDIIVAGRLGAEEWTKDGVDQSKHTIICESFSLVGGAPLTDAQQKHTTEKANAYNPHEAENLPF
jgi:single-stranded DNA-binding protein